MAVVTLKPKNVVMPLSIKVKLKKGKKLDKHKKQQKQSVS